MSVLQKLVANSWISELPPSGIIHWLRSKWDAFLVRGLGLVPLDEIVSDGIRSEGAFQLLRVRSIIVVFIAYLHF